MLDDQNYIPGRGRECYRNSILRLYRHITYYSALFTNSDTYKNCNTLYFSELYMLSVSVWLISSWMFLLSTFYRFFKLSLRHGVTWDRASQWGVTVTYGVKKMPLPTSSLLLFNLLTGWNKQFSCVDFELASLLCQGMIRLSAIWHFHVGKHATCYSETFLTTYKLIRSHNWDHSPIWPLSARCFWDP